MVYISTVLGLLLPEFTCSTISHSFGSGPIMSGTFSLTFSKVLSVAISCGIFFCFRSSCRWSYSFLTGSRFYSGLYLYSSSSVIIANLFELGSSPSWAESPFLFLGDVVAELSLSCSLSSIVVSRSSEFDINKVKLLDGLESARFKLVFVVIEL